MLADCKSSQMDKVSSITVTIGMLQCPAGNIVLQVASCMTLAQEGWPKHCMNLHGPSQNTALSCRAPASGMFTSSTCLHTAVPCRAQVGGEDYAVQADAVIGVSSTESWHIHLTWQRIAACLDYYAPEPMQGP